MLNLYINGDRYRIDLPGDTPLLWVLRDQLGLTGTKFGCGEGLCGACTVHIDGEAARACQTPISTLNDKEVTTIEGLSPRGDHPLQKAWVAEEVPQCGYCQCGMIMSAAALLKKKPKPSETEIDQALAGNLCRCGTYNRIRKAVQRAALPVGKQGGLK
ncbi:MAG: (2Fe-2S)-binding protein [Betaproteobacteria bacterium]|nr:(2Fe-2S)-binding protein [Betaproteobacteria bacterium]